MIATLIRYNDSLLTVLLLLLVMIFMAELGYRRGHRARKRGMPEKGVELIEGALLTLLALLLAFGVSMAESRFDTRIQRMLLEANTIGTAYLRTELIPEPARAEIKEAMRNYLDSRVEFYRYTREDAGVDALDAKTNIFEAQIWRLVTENARKYPTSSTNILILGGMNEMFDARSEQDALFRIKLPKSISYLLLICSTLVVALVGYGYGLAGARHFAFTAMLSVVISLTLFVLLDLDRPRRGLIRISPDPLVYLQKQFRFQK